MKGTLKNIISCATVLILMLLISCNNAEDYREEHQSLNGEALKTCEMHGQIYSLHYTTDLKSYEVQCYQESPLRFFYYKIK